MSKSKFEEVEIDQCSNCKAKKSRRVVATAYDKNVGVRVYSILCDKCEKTFQFVNISDFVRYYDKSKIVDEFLVTCDYCGNHDMTELYEVNGYFICINREECIERIK